MDEKILVVDDELETLRLVGIMLQKQGYAIIAASNGAQALSSAKIEQPDLILLDLMLPDMDGYEVTRQLKSDPLTANIPVLMFSAKSQVDDRIKGFEAGIDDYLTKPTHPLELTAHVKSLLNRSTKSKNSNQTIDHGHIIGFVAAKGGIGTSSLVLNVGVHLVKKTKAEIIAVEMHPGMGNWGLELGINKPEGLDRLLELKPGEITSEKVKHELIPLPIGLQLLLSSYNIKDVNQLQAVPQMEVVINQLYSMSQLVLLDIGNAFFPNIDKVFNICNELVVAVEPHPITVLRTKSLLTELHEKGYGKSKAISVVLINRIRSDVQMSWTQVSEVLEQQIKFVISPYPEMAFQAATRALPIIQIQPEGLTAQQYGNVADFLAQSIHKKS